MATSRLNLASTHAHLDDTQVFMDKGIVSKFDVVKAELEVSQAAETLSQALNRSDLAKATLLVVLNDPGPFRWKLEPPTPLEVEETIRLEDLKRVGLATRPEVRAADISLDSARRLVDAAYAESNPVLTLSVDYSRQQGNTLFPDDVTQTVLGFQIPLFDGGVRAAKVKEAESSLRALESSTALLHDQVALEVETAWLDLKQAGVTFHAAQKNVQSAEVAHQMGEARYQYGISTSLELEDTLRSLTGARSDLVVARHQLATAFASLERALGLDVPERRLTADFVITLLDGEEPPDAEQ